jgi:hypothetical protein
MEAREEHEMIFEDEIKEIEEAKGEKAFSLALSYFLENQYKELTRWDVLRMLERSIDRWKKNPECFSKEMGNNIKIYLLMKNLQK